MDLYKIEICGKDFDKIPNEEQVLFVHLAQLTNTIEILEKLVYFTRAKSQDEVMLHATITQQSLTMRLLSGVLWEGWQLLNKSYFCNLSKTFDSKLSGQGRSNLAKIKKYFSQDNIIKHIRNKFAFHYNPDEILTELSQIDPENKYILYLSKTHFNGLNYFAEELFGMSMLGSISNIVGSNDANVVHEKLFEDVLSLSQAFINFAGDCLRVILEKRLNISLDEESPKVVLNNLPKMDTIEIPYFIERPNKNGD